MTEIEELALKLGDKEWRIFSWCLYFIKDKDGNKTPFKPNEAQKHFYKHKHTKNIILKARQLGFSTLIDIDLLDEALFGSYLSTGIIADNKDNAKMIFKDKIKFVFENLPDWLKAEFSVNTDRKWELVFDSNSCSVAVDTSFRWGTLQYLHISEYWKICSKYPEKAREIQTWALNTVAPTSIVNIESTAEGNSWNFYDMATKAMEFEETKKPLTDMDYKFHFYWWWLDPRYSLSSWDVITQETEDYFQKITTNEWIMSKYPDLVFTKEQKRWYQKKQEEQREDMQREFPSYPKEAFDLAIKGAYYEKELSTTRLQGRVWKYQYDHRLPVYTHWDIGGAGWWDETAIWFYQVYAKEIRLIDYWEWSGYGLTEIAYSIVNPRYKNYHTHFLPHDIKVTEFGNGTTRYQTACECLEWEIEIVPKLPISDWINAVRDMFPSCYFNEETCSLWLSRLAWYRRSFDEKNWIYRQKPQHDINSNGADAFRYLGVTKMILTAIKTKAKIYIPEYAWI